MPAHSDTPRPSFRLRRSPPAIAVVGATGAVGQEMLRVLDDRLFPVRELRLFASPRSAGKTLPFAGRDVTVEPLSARSFDGIDLALFFARPRDRDDHRVRAADRPGTSARPAVGRAWNPAGR